MRSTVQIPLWIPAFLLMLSLPGQAAEWSVEPAIFMSTSYNDNIRLDNNSADAVLESAVTPTVKFGVAKINQGLFGKAYASVRRFSGGTGRNSSSVLDREDYRFDTNAYHRTLRNTYSGILRFSRDSTLDSQLDQTGEVISSRATRSSIGLGPSWTGTLSEQTLLNLGYNFTTVSYPDGTGIQRLIEYDTDQFSASLTHQYTPRIRGTLSASYSSYQPDTNRNSDTINLQAGIAQTFSETLSTSWLAGYRETTSDTLIATGFCVGADPGAKFPGCKGGTPVQTGTADDEDVNTGSVFSANITKLLRKGSLRANLSRSSNPSSRGGLLDTTRLMLTGTYRFSQRLNASLLLKYSKAETISTGTANSSVTDTTLYTIRPKLNWQWRKKVQLSAGYQYITREDKNGDRASGNAVTFTLRYTPYKTSISR